jgi:hypothetical protein
MALLREIRFGSSLNHEHRAAADAATTKPNLEVGSQQRLGGTDDTPFNLSDLSHFHFLWNVVLEVLLDVFQGAHIKSVTPTFNLIKYDVYNVTDFVYRPGLS